MPVWLAEPGTLLILGYNVMKTMYLTFEKISREKKNEPFVAYEWSMH
jgi:hypothetical protein